MIKPKNISFSYLVSVCFLFSEQNMDILFDDFKANMFEKGLFRFCITVYFTS